MQSPQFIPQGAIRSGERGVFSSRMIAAGQERSLLGPPQGETEMTTKHRTYPSSLESSTDGPPAQGRSFPHTHGIEAFLPGYRRIRAGSFRCVSAGGASRSAAVHVVSRMAQRLTVRPGASRCRGDPSRLAAPLPVCARRSRDCRTDGRSGMVPEYLRKSRTGSAPSPGAREDHTAAGVPAA